MDARAFKKHPLVIDKVIGQEQRILVSRAQLANAAALIPGAIARVLLRKFIRNQ